MILVGPHVKKLVIVSRFDLLTGVDRSNHLSTVQDKKSKGCLVGCQESTIFLSNPSVLPTGTTTWTRCIGSTFCARQLHHPQPYSFQQLPSMVPGVTMWRSKNTKTKSPHFPPFINHCHAQSRARKQRQRIFFDALFIERTLKTVKKGLRICSHRSIHDLPRAKCAIVK
jgi:hypothetical protein